ncbi:MAG: MBL fold metallo-hydrolase [Actinobacteria bacterium]|nr:MBL fold metallo-hydrolase [Actinomycetota bacterium]
MTDASSHPEAGATAQGDASPPAPNGAEPPRIERQERLPAAEEVTEVAEGIFRMQLPIDLPGLGHVNCYALEDERGFTVVDPGYPDPETAAALETRFRSIGASISRVHTVFVTHSHPDHFGGAGRLRYTNDADIMAHRSFTTRFDPHDDSVELETLDPAKAAIAGALAEAVLGDGPIPDFAARRAPWGGSIPVPSRHEIEQMRSWDRDTRWGFVHNEPNVRIDHDQVIRLGRRDFVAVHTPGHTGDHLCLVDLADGVLLCGDHVLPTITPHISGMTASPDSLAEFFGALDVVRRLPDIRLALPAHGHPIDDVVGRVDAIERHHIERLEQIERIGAELGTGTVTEYSQRLFAPRSWGAMAESETYAHLEHLRNVGRALVGERDGFLTYEIVD